MAIWSSFPAYYRPPFFLLHSLDPVFNRCLCRSRERSLLSTAQIGNLRYLPVLSLYGFACVAVLTVMPFPPSGLHPIFQFLLRLSSAPKQNVLPSSVVPEVKLCPHLKQANGSDLKSFLSCCQKSFLTKRVSNVSVSFRYSEKIHRPTIDA